ncbi:hypothetical protein HYH03_005190 [Edaphochlamys debaryana]|uniref:Apyrase n=1 Tax=Edaphochlamys debaryana TaxID=47281 RepID=A0A836C2G6_9CHLO|nr:hypothetical protein HYH03_005190 [Edaphochlamys debaryana]|eukprot:KAG2496782.1 hypothetical protein HYH03_005190 [Edaphochlamys debaryana]
MRGQQSSAARPRVVAVMVTLTLVATTLLLAVWSALNRTPDSTQRPSFWRRPLGSRAERSQRYPSRHPGPPLSVSGSPPSQLSPHPGLSSNASVLTSQAGAGSLAGVPSANGHLRGHAHTQGRVQHPEDVAGWDATEVRDIQEAGTSLSSSAASAASAKRPERYAVLIDAGSSGTRVHVYRYRDAVRPGVSYPAVHLPGAIMRVHPGLSEYAPAGEGVEESLSALIKFALEQVPAAQHSLTPIRLLATAGLRLLPAEEAAAVLAAAARVLAASGFLFVHKADDEQKALAGTAPESAWIRILTGDEEGLYAWAGINYAAGRLQALAEERFSSPRRRDPAAMAGRAVAHTLAVLELGGASLQLTLMPWEPLPPERRHRLGLPGVDLPLYTHSFLGYGLQVAWFREAMLVQQGGGVATDPCLHPGYVAEDSGVTGSGSFEDCARLAEQLVLAAGGGASSTAASSSTSTGTADGNGVEDSAPQLADDGGSSTSGRGGSSSGGSVSEGVSGSGGKQGCAYARCSIGGEYLPRLLPLGAPVKGVAGAAAAAKGKGTSKAAAAFRGAAAAQAAHESFIIMATESFHYTRLRLGLPPESTLEDFREAGRRFCARAWADVESEFVLGAGMKEDHVLKTCFGAAYIHTLLKQAFHFGPREASYLRFSNDVPRPDGSEVEANWVLGALLVEVAQPRAHAAITAAARQASLKTGAATAGAPGKGTPSAAKLGTDAAAGPADAAPVTLGAAANAPDGVDVSAPAAAAGALGAAGAGSGVTAAAVQPRGVAEAAAEGAAEGWHRAAEAAIPDTADAGLLPSRRLTATVAAAALEALRSPGAAELGAARSPQLCLWLGAAACAAAVLAAALIAAVVLTVTISRGREGTEGAGAGAGRALPSPCALLGVPRRVRLGGRLCQWRRAFAWRQGLQGGRAGHVEQGQLAALDAVVEAAALEEVAGMEGGGVQGCLHSCRTAACGGQGLVLTMRCSSSM